MIKYVQFLSDIPIGGHFHSISSWTPNEHGKHLSIEETKRGIMLTVLTEGPQHGETLEVFASNIASIRRYAPGAAQKPLPAHVPEPEAKPDAKARA